MKRTFILLLEFVPLMLSAHPGHDGSEGSDGYTIIHYLTSTDHLLVTGLSMIILAVAWMALRKKKNLSDKKS